MVVQHIATSLQSRRPNKDSRVTLTERKDGTSVARVSTSWKDPAPN